MKEPSAIASVANVPAIAAVPGQKPFVYADWQQVVFLHFEVAPESIRPWVPFPLELELFQGRACVSLVALTMRHFRPEHGLIAWPLRLLHEQRFFNVRTYVRFGTEQGAFFMRGWLSKPLGLGLPSGLFDLPYGFGSLKYDHSGGEENLKGEVTDANQRFAYCARKEKPCEAEPCRPGSLAEFTLERYTGFFAQGGDLKVFRAGHPRWLQTPLSVQPPERALLQAKFPWFQEAKLLGGNYAPGFARVSLWRPQRLLPARRHVLSSFYDLP